MKKIFLQKNLNGTFSIIKEDSVYIESGFCGELIPFNEIYKYFKEKEDDGDVKVIYYFDDTNGLETYGVYKQIPENFYVNFIRRTLQSSVSNEIINGTAKYYFYGADNNLKKTKVFYAISQKELLNILKDYAKYNDATIDIFSIKEAKFILKWQAQKDAIISASSDINKEDFLKQLKKIGIKREVIF